MSSLPFLSRTMRTVPCMLGTLPWSARQAAKAPSMKNRKTEKLPRKSGYAEPQPQTNKHNERVAEAKTPHESRNVPARKPYPSSG